MKQQCLELYAGGMTANQVEAATGVSADSIVAWAKQAGLVKRHKYSDTITAYLESPGKSKSSTE
ncbi:MAG TPA: hypothetical protein V6D14_14090 [Coleofasciculaceae cyanobacterium]|jgi:hypothetical protein